MTQITVHMNPKRNIWQVATDIDHKLVALVKEGVLKKYEVEQLFPGDASEVLRAMFIADCQGCHDPARIVAAIRSVDGVDTAQVAPTRHPAI